MTTWLIMDGVHLQHLEEHERNAYCNLDIVIWKYRTIRNGSEQWFCISCWNISLLITVLRINADVHYWETEADNVYYPYFVQQSYDAGYIINNDGELLYDW